MLHKEIPFLRISIPLCAGIISGIYIKPDIIFLLPVAAIIVSGFSLSLLYNNIQTNQIFGLALTISLFTAGLLLYTHEKNSISTLKSEESMFVCTLSDYLQEKENSFKLTVKLNKKITRHGYESANGSVILYQKKDSSKTFLLPGDLLIVKCTPLEVANRGNPNEFDYKFYLNNQGIRYYAFTSSHDIISHVVPNHRKLIHRALILREKIIWMYKERGITGERLALVAAITLGQKNMLDPEQKNYFIKAGIMHIMAVSGLHAVILSLFILNMLFFLKGRFNIIRILITIIILWSFAFVTGLTPSVLRATLMFSFLQAGNIMKRQVNGINSVLASAFVLILIKPSVIFDAGFLLSYSAVIYIIAFYRELYQKMLFNNRIIDMIWQSAVVTIVAQAGTLPLTITLFNRFPTYFILTNVIIVPLSSMLIVIGCLVPMLFPVRFLSQFLAIILNNLTGLTELLTRKASSLPLATIENIGMTTIECLLLTVTLFLFSYFLLKKQSFSPIFMLGVITIFLLAGTAREISTRITNELIVYNTPGSSTIGIRTGKIIHLYSDTTATRAEVMRHCASLALKIKTTVLKDNYYFLSAGGTKILITNSLDNKIYNSFAPDIVILTGSGPVIENYQHLSNQAKTMIILAEGFPGYSISQHNNFSGMKLVYVVRKSGAFTRRI